MKTAGGILAIIGGIFGIIAALLTLGIGGIGSAVGQEDMDTVGLLGLGGLLFSILVIIFAGLSLKAQRKVIPFTLIALSLAGAILGGGFVAFCMVLSIIGGVLCVFGTKSNPETQDN